MAYENKKAVRAAASRFDQESTDALLARYAEPMTQSECQAIERVLRQRQVALPAQKGPVSEDEQATNIIRIEDLAQMQVKEEKSQLGMGFVEGICLLVGTLLTVILWKSHAWIALFYGFGVSLALYAGLSYLRRFWKEMGRQK